MLSLNLASLFLLVALGAVWAIEVTVWRSETHPLQKLRGHLAWAVLGLLMVYLAWAGMVRQHIPPTGLDEVLTGLTGLILLGFLGLRVIVQRSSGFFSLGLLLSLLLFGLGSILSWRGDIYVGREPLGAWGVLARWLILGGVAGLTWLALLSALTLWCEAMRRPHWQATLGLSTTQALALSRRFEPPVILMILVGGALFSLRDWWGWGTQVNRGLAVAVVLLCLLAASWLRFTAPYRRWWAWALTVAAFPAALATLAAIAAR